MICDIKTNIYLKRDILISFWASITWLISTRIGHFVKKDGNKYLHKTWLSNVDFQHSAGQMSSKSESWHHRDDGSGLRKNIWNEEAGLWWKEQHVHKGPGNSPFYWLMQSNLDVGLYTERNKKNCKSCELTLTHVVI